MEIKKRDGCTAVALAGLLLFSGCGGQNNQLETARVNGKVLYQGQPIAIGSLMFVPIDKAPPAQGNIAPDGTFVMGTYAEADGAVIGQHKVSITAVTGAGGTGLPEDEIDGIAGLKSIIPDFYSSEDKSGLVVDIKPGENNLTFELSKDSGKVVAE